MLAYVFWHIPAPSADIERYERLLLDFHKILKSNAPTGFKTSFVFRIQNAPWIASASPAYEDWYIIENSAALDPLNDAAISGPRKAPHDLVASLAASGAAGLYRLKSGQLESMKFARHSLWFSKPAITYNDFFTQLRPASEAPQTNLWLRQMVLSAAPEFCLRSAKPLDLPNIAIAHCPIQAIHPT
jgi:hypothetical protein